MSVAQTENLNIVAVDHMPSPEEIKARVPLTEHAAAVVLNGRKTLTDILDRKDNRLFVVIGPAPSTIRSRAWTTRAGSRRWPMRSPARCNW